MRDLTDAFEAALLENRILRGELCLFREGARARAAILRGAVLASSSACMESAILRKHAALRRMLQP